MTLQDDTTIWHYKITLQDDTTRWRYKITLQDATRDKTRRLSPVSHLCELLHVGGLDVHDVEWLVGDLHVPQVDPQVVRRQIGLLQEAGKYG